MKSKVYKVFCICCGAFAAILFYVFDIDVDGLACAKGEVTESNKDEVIDASESCPTGGISVEE